jgi:hypothetical protein
MILFYRIILNSFKYFFSKSNVRYDFSHSDILWYPKTSNLEIREVKIILFSKKFPKFLFAEIWIMILLSSNNIYSLFNKGLSLRISFC